MRTILLLLISLNLFCQNKRSDTVYCDCSQAKAITITGRTAYGKTVAPKGGGKVNEIGAAKQKTSYAFEKEHNSAWYKLIIQTTGKLSMNVIPTKPDDDYDFMIFRAGEKNFCDSLLNYTINPVRACISRDKEEIEGKTGMNLKSPKEFVKHGVGPAYCKFLSVKKGEVYFLVLDNVYEKGEGHTLEFEISQIVILKGIVIDENNKPVQSEISLTNQKGDIVYTEQTKADGSYSFTAPLTKNQSYNLNFYNDSNFSFTKSFTIDDTLQLTALKTVLPKLRKGSKYSVGSINFIANSVQYLPRAIPAMNNLAKLLKKNPGLRIKIFGHQNGMSMDDNRDIAFTRSRARTIRNYLVIQGIDESRILIGGKGGSEMLFESPATENEQEQNRRVEILVIDY